MKVDLHTHTRVSDGTLTPDQLLHSAAAAGVQLLAITDHDAVAAHVDLRPPPGLRVLPGIELSTRCDGVGVHVLGLGVDVASAAMREAVALQQAARAERARRIALALDWLQVPDLYDRARALTDGAPGRPHFAAALVAAGTVRNERKAFSRYLGKGKPGDVHTRWAELRQVLAWIHAAGGISVLAHPARYGLTRTRLGRLVRSFAASGGEALEVLCGRQDPATTSQLAALAAEHGLLASSGSDFHSPAQRWLSLGGQGELPPGCRPVWEALSR